MLTRIAAVLFVTLLSLTTLVVGASCAQASALWSMSALQVSVRPAVGGAATADDLYDQLGARPPDGKAACRGELEINASNWARPGARNTAIACRSLASIERGGDAGGSFADTGADTRAADAVPVAGEDGADADTDVNASDYLAPDAESISGSADDADAAGSDDGRDRSRNAGSAGSDASRDRSGNADSSGGRRPNKRDSGTPGRTTRDTGNAGRIEGAGGAGDGSGGAEDDSSDSGDDSGDSGDDSGDSGDDSGSGKDATSPGRGKDTTPRGTGNRTTNHTGKSGSGAQTSDSDSDSEPDQASEATPKGAKDPTTAPAGKRASTGPNNTRSFHPSRGKQYWGSGHGPGHGTARQAWRDKPHRHIKCSSKHLTAKQRAICRRHRGRH